MKYQLIKKKFFIKKSADKGNKSMASLAKMLANGNGCKLDYEKAVEYAKMSADKGNSEEQIDNKEVIKYYKNEVEKRRSHTQ